MLSILGWSSPPYPFPKGLRVAHDDLMAGRRGGCSVNGFLGSLLGLH